MLDLIVEHQAGIPVLMKPLRGHSSDVQDFGHLVTAHMAQLQITYGTMLSVADSALYRAENLQQLAETRATWITRVAATLSEAQAVLAQADPHTMAPLTEGYRSHVVRASYGGVEPRWVLFHSAVRQPQAQRTVDKQLLKQREQEGTTFKKLCRTALAGVADVPQALATFAQGLQATFVAQSTVRPIPRYDKRGRPGHGPLPDQVVYQLEGALAMRIAARQALVDQPSYFIRATNERADTLVSPQELFAGYKGQARAERGFRFLIDPQFLASSRYLTKPQRIMALLMVMTVCLLVYAALEYRIRQVLKAHEATCPDQQGKRIQNPTARWVFHYFVGIHL